MKSYIAIDLKSFYASVECVERGLDPLTKTITPAIRPYRPTSNSLGFGQVLHGPNSHEKAGLIRQKGILQSEFSSSPSLHWKICRKKLRSLRDGCGAT